VAGRARKAHHPVLRPLRRAACLVARGGSKCSSSASFRFANASSSDSPWLATSTSRHCETNQFPSRQTVAANGRFMPTFSHGHHVSGRTVGALTRSFRGTADSRRHIMPGRILISIESLFSSWWWDAEGHFVRRPRKQKQRGRAAGVHQRPEEISGPEIPRRALVPDLPALVPYLEASAQNRVSAASSVTSDCAGWGCEDQRSTSRLQWCSAQNSRLKKTTGPQASLRIESFQY